MIASHTKDHGTSYLMSCNGHTSFVVGNLLFLAKRILCCLRPPRRASPKTCTLYTLSVSACQCVVGAFVAAGESRAFIDGGQVCVFLQGHLTEPKSGHCIVLMISVLHDSDIFHLISPWKPNRDRGDTRGRARGLTGGDAFLGQARIRF